MITFSLKLYHHEYSHSAKAMQEGTHYTVTYNLLFIECKKVSIVNYNILLHLS